MGSRISKFLHPAQRYDDFKLIRITCQAACHGKTEHGIFVKFEKPKKTAVVFIASLSSLHCDDFKLIKFKKPSKTAVVLIASLSSLHYDDFKLIRITCQAACHGKTELNMAYLSSLKNQAKLLLSSLPHCPHCIMMILNLSSLKNRAKLLLSSLPHCPHCIMMILNLSELLAKPLVMAKPN